MSPTLSFIPKSLDLAVYAGDGCAVRIIVRDKSTGTSLSVVGDHSAQIRTNRLDVAAVESFEIDDSNASDGVLLLSLSGEQTADLGDGFKGVWDLQWIAPGAEPMTLVQGKITCTIDVTRP